MFVNMTDTQKGDLQYADPVDKKGNKAPIQAGSLIWMSSDPTVATVVPVSEDPIVGTLTAGKPGVCQVWPKADADTGLGDVPIEGQKVDVSVSGGMATGFGAPTIGPLTEQ